MRKDVLGYVEREDLPEGSRELVDIIGIDLVLELIDYCGGSGLYLPSKGSVIKSARNRIIKRDFDGGNIKELAAKFEISDVQVRNILKNR